MQVEIFGIPAGECYDYECDSFYRNYSNFIPSKEFIKMFPNFPNKKIDNLCVGFEDGQYHFQVYEKFCEEGDMRMIFDAVLVIEKAHLVLQDLE